MRSMVRRAGLARPRLPIEARRVVRALLTLMLAFPAAARMERIPPGPQMLGFRLHLSARFAHFLRRLGTRGR